MQTLESLGNSIFLVNSMDKVGKISTDLMCVCPNLNH